MSGMVLEFILRSGSVVSGVGALVAGCIAINNFLGLSDLLRVPVSDDLSNNTNAAVALAIIAAIVTAIVELIFIIVRFTNSGKNFNKVLMLLDVALTVLLGAAFATAGVIAAIATQDWSDLINNIRALVPDSTLYTDIRDPLAGAAACALTAALMLILLLVWMVLSLIFRKRMLNYSSV